MSIAGPYKWLPTPLMPDETWFTLCFFADFFCFVLLLAVPVPETVEPMGF